jgi:hypothetical protein
MAKVYDTATDLIAFARLQSQNTTSGSSYLGSDGLLKFAAEDEPRIEYGSDGSLKGLLIEEQRTNLITHSEDFSHSSWVKNNGSVSADATAAPSGGLADQYVEDTSNSYHRYAVQCSVTSGVTYTLSVYAKYIGRQYLVINADSLFGGRCVFDIQAGSISNEIAGTANIEDVGDGWYRCSVTATAASTSSLQVYIGANTTNADSAYTGDGTSGIYVWGAQLEEGSFATSYIPTSGSQQTRSADVASIPVTAFGYNQSAGTVVVEASSPVGDNDNRLAILVDAGTADNRVVDLYRQSTAIRMYNGYTALSLVYPNNPAEGLTAAGAYSAGDYAHIVDGGSPSTANSASVNDPDTLFIGCNGVSQRQLNGHIKSIQYYPRRLTNTQLQELTA